MKLGRRFPIGVLFLTAIVINASCEQKQETPPPKPAAQAKETKPPSTPTPANAAARPAPPPSQPAAAGGKDQGGIPVAGGAVSATEPSLSLTGLSMTVPTGWAADPVPASLMGPVAAYRLPKADGDAQDGAVRITHYPNMKGMDDANIARWVGQMKRPDGEPCTRDDAKITVEEHGNVRLTIVDISGALSAAMDGSGGGVENQRLIAAILDHPQGPHFVKASGGSATMRRWEESVRAFFASAAVR